MITVNVQESGVQISYLNTIADAYDLKKLKEKLLTIPIYAEMRM